MKINKALLLIIVVCAANTSAAQSISRQVLANGGTTAISGSLMLCWTLGQPGPVELASSPSYIITQGFQQGDEPLVGIAQQIPGEVLIKVFPNPSNAIFHIAGNLPGTRELFCNIYDSRGRAIDFETRITVEADGHFNAQIDLSGFATGVYLLRLHDAGRIPDEFYSFILTLVQ